MNEFFTWSLLSSYSGAILAVTIITQFIKGIGLIDKIPTRFVSWIVAVIVLILAQAFTAQLTVSSAVLTLLNAVVVSLAANGTFDLIADGGTKRIDID